MRNASEWPNINTGTRKMKAHLSLIQRPAGFFSLCLLFLVSMVFVWQVTGLGTAALAGSSSDEQFSVHLAGHAGAELRVVGATTIQPIVQKIADVYRKKAGVEILLQGGGSSHGVAAVRAMTADIGMVSRELTPEEAEEFEYVVIGNDAVAIIVNSHNPRQAVSREELRNIYTGRTRTWFPEQEGQADIVLVSKLIGRGTLAIFEDYTGLRSPFHAPAVPHEQGQETISTSAWEAGANLDSILWVGGVRGAIGFVSIGDAQRFIRLGMPIRVLEVDQTLPTPEQVTEGTYPLRRGLHLVYLRGNARAEEFARFMLTAPGQTEVRKQGFVPLPAPGGPKEIRP